MNESKEEKLEKGFVLFDETAKAFYLADSEKEPLKSQEGVPLWVTCPHCGKGVLDEGELDGKEGLLCSHCLKVLPKWGRSALGDRIFDEDVLKVLRTCVRAGGEPERVRRDVYEMQGLLEWGWKGCAISHESPETLAREYERKYLKQVYMELMALQHLLDFNDSDPRLDGISFLTCELSDKIVDMKVKVGSACDLLGKIIRRERKHRWN